MYEGETHIKPPPLSHKPQLCAPLPLGTSESTEFLSWDRCGAPWSTDDQNLTSLRNYKVNVALV